RRIAVVFPDRLQIIAIPFFDGFGVKGVAPAVAATKEDKLLAVYLSSGRRTPLTMENAGANLGLVFRPQGAGLFIEGNETGRKRRRDVGMGPVLAVGRADVHDIIDNQNRAVRSVVGKNPEFLH